MSHSTLELSGELTSPLSPTQLLSLLLQPSANLHLSSTEIHLAEPLHLAEHSLRRAYPIRIIYRASCLVMHAKRSLVKYEPTPKTSPRVLLLRAVITCPNAAL